MTIYDFLANHSPNRMIDRVFVMWYANKYSLAYILRSQEEWTALYGAFSGETETDRSDVLKTPKNLTAKKEYVKKTEFIEPIVEEKSATKGAK